MKNAEPEPVEIEVTATEAAALQGTWNHLGPLISFAIQRLGREEGLKLCNGLNCGDLLVTWILRGEGLATCTIWRGAEIIYRFEFEHHPASFHFAEIPSGPAN